MNHNTNYLDKQYLLHVPTAFVLENKTLTQVEGFFDDNGWTILHLAVAELNIPKIIELLHFNFNVGIQSTHNNIPIEIYLFNEKKKISKLVTFSKIPFCKNGFTAAHLALFLFNFYDKLSDDFFYKEIADKYQIILNLFINKETKFKNYFDCCNNSLFDYTFLLENITLIEFMHMNDQDFSSLNKVLPTTAKKIVEVMSIKYKNCDNPHLLNLLSKKILHSSLNKNLENKTPHKNKTINKI
ncbi:hypothetical protein GW796_06100 [archaeon]|nr:hypothetical protein [archaeon]